VDAALDRACLQQLLDLVAEPVRLAQVEGAEVREKRFVQLHGTRQPGASAWRYAMLQILPCHCQHSSIYWWLLVGNIWDCPAA
jgi:hypothetical protein